jgi:aerobic carbon-monoxide dehydrogenase medium subunit
MYAPAFDYHRAASLDDAHRLLATHQGAKLLAGGHSLIPMLKLRLAGVPALIDIGRIAELRGISRDADGLRIGALTTHAEIAASREIADEAPALADAAALVGDPAVRNRGTIGGNIAHADPASDLPTVLVALGARVVAHGPSRERTIDAEQFFTGVMATALHDNEIIKAIVIPTGDGSRTSAYAKFAHPASRYAVVGAAVALTIARGKCAAARVAVGGLVSLDTAAIDAAVRTLASSLGADVTGDLFASAEYRGAVAPVYVQRALAAAASRAGAR